MKKIFAIGLLALTGCFSHSGDSRQPASAKTAGYQACICNFNGCLGERKKSCTAIIQCRKTTADVYAQTVGNRKALLVLDSHRFCIDPDAGLMRGD